MPHLIAQAEVGGHPGFRLLVYFWVCVIAWALIMAVSRRAARGTGVRDNDSASVGCWTAVLLVVALITLVYLDPIAVMANRPVIPVPPATFEAGEPTALEHYPGQTRYLERITRRENPAPPRPVSIEAPPPAYPSEEVRLTNNGGWVRTSLVPRVDALFRYEILTPGVTFDHILVRNGEGGVSGHPGARHLDDGRTIGESTCMGSNPLKYTHSLRLEGCPVNEVRVVVTMQQIGDPVPPAKTAAVQPLAPWRHNTDRPRHGEKGEVIDRYLVVLKSGQRSEVLYYALRPWQPGERDRYVRQWRLITEFKCTLTTWINGKALVAPAGQKTNLEGSYPETITGDLTVQVEVGHEVPESEVEFVYYREPRS